MESDSGVTSKSRMLFAFTNPVELPDSVAPWMAAPVATHSSGLMDDEGSLPVSSRTFCWTAGMRVEPPTKRTQPSSLAAMPASLSAVVTGPSVRCTRSAVIWLKALRVSVVSK